MVAIAKTWPFQHEPEPTGRLRAKGDIKMTVTPYLKEFEGVALGIFMRRVRQSESAIASIRIRIDDL